MKFRFLTLFTLCLLTSGMYARPSERVTISRTSEEGWRSLFNGSTLEGWIVKCIPGDKEKKYWSVNNGTIECNSLDNPDHHYVWLVTEDVFDDFHLKLQFQVFKSSTGNSGVQFRSRYDDSDTALFGGWLNGPQADIDPQNSFRAGLIYDETNRVRRWIYPSMPDWNISIDQAPASAHETKLVFADDDPDAWNSMEIICDGTHIQTFVNGMRVTDFDANGILNDKVHKERGIGMNGVIALQLHSRSELVIRFREIFIKEL